MSHSVSIGETWHTRLTPVEHSFVYPVIYMTIDLNQWYKKTSSLFSFDKWNMFSVHGKEFLSKDPVSVTKKVHRELIDHGYTQEVSSIVLHTAPRFFGLVFNPVNFYYCYSKDALSVVLVEINNTFGEKHTYCVPITDEKSYRVAKEFHVSPFNEVEGHYIFQFDPISNKYQIHVDLEKQGLLTFKSGISLEPKEITTARLMSIAVRYPVVLLGTTVRIGIQAFKLYFLKKMPVIDKPEPRSEFTRKWTRPVLLQRLITGEYLERIQTIFMKKKGK